VLGDRTSETQDHYRSRPLAAIFILSASPSRKEFSCRKSQEADEKARRVEAAWKGYLQINLVSVPVKAYTSTASSGDVELNQLHADCNARIHWKLLEDSWDGWNDGLSLPPGSQGFIALVIRPGHSHEAAKRA